MLHVETARLCSDSSFPDPLDEDADGDEKIVLTRRGLIRLALVASEVGGRFARDGLDVDPMAWMLSPRRIFGGGAAVDACLQLEGCTRALVLHGLGLGLDAGSDEISDLLDDGVADVDAFGACLAA